MSVKLHLQPSPIHTKQFSTFPSTRHHSRISPKCSSSPKPPTTKEEAILQAKTSLSAALQKPLNNPKLTGKIKKIKQPRFLIEIPIIDDDSPSSLSQLAFQLFGDMPISRKGSKIKILILWSTPTLTQSAIDDAFHSHSSKSILVQNTDILSSSSSLDADVAVFLAPETSELEIMKRVSENLNPRPIVMVNPKWGFEEEGGFGDGVMRGFVGSFEVVYSFMGLEVRGILSKRKGVVFKCVRDGVVSGEKWDVLVEEENGELTSVARFKDRPSIVEVENVLYNVMAINSPITKSAKFIKDLVSNVYGKKR